MSDVGKIIWTRNHREKGIIKKESNRYCAVCGYHSCYIVDWSDGTRTKPCTRGVAYNNDDELEIM